MTLTVPAGNVRSQRPTGGAFDIPWTNVARWEPAFSEAAAESGQPAALLAAMALVESDANHYRTGRTTGTRAEVLSVDDRFGDGPSVGIMQVKPRLWQSVLPDADAYEPTGSIRLGAALMARFVRETGSWQAAIRERYHPGTSAGGVTPQAYVDAIAALMREMGVVDWAPVIYDLANDAHAARFGLSPAERDVITGRGAARKASSIQAVGLHVQWGNTPGSLDHWLAVSASSTVMVQRDGSILRVIPELRVPWTQGDVKSPDAEARRLMDRFGRDPNQYSLTIEAEDLREEDVTSTQERTIVWQIREWARKYGAHLLDPERILGHYQINSVDRARCGRYVGRIEAQLAGAAPVPEPPPVVEFAGLPAWLPADAFEAAFPLADPGGVVTKRLIAWIAETGELPWWVGKTDLGNGRNLWRFDRLTLLNDGPRAWAEGETP